jgi:hypothetical protein
MTGKTITQGVNMRNYNAKKLREEHLDKHSKKKSSNRRRRLTNDDLHKIANEIEVTGNPRKK